MHNSVRRLIQISEKKLKWWSLFWSNLYSWIYQQKMKLWAFLLIKQTPNILLNYIKLLFLKMEVLKLLHELSFKTWWSWHMSHYPSFPGITEDLRFISVNWIFFPKCSRSNLFCLADIYKSSSAFSKVICTQFCNSEHFKWRKNTYHQKYTTPQ